MNLSQRSYEKELLDKDEIPFDDIRQNMQELDTINTILGGHAITVAGLKKLIGKLKTIHVCEIGCGGGDNLVAILKWCNKNNLAVTFTGIDIKQSCIDFAASKMLLRQQTKWICTDYYKVSFSKKPDIIFSSLFCHHFTDDELTKQLLWMKENSSIGFFINDLQRNIIAYRSIQLLTSLFSNSYLVKNDAPLSVARGFKKRDWQRIFENAGIKNYSIRWKWAFRYLITYAHATTL